VPKADIQSSLISLREKKVKIGAKIAHLDFCAPQLTKIWLSGRLWQKHHSNVGAV